MTAYQSTARYYDAMYRHKDYAQEVQSLLRMIDSHARRPYQTLLDVGCGTGTHLSYLLERYRCTGVDLSEEMLAIAREKLPNISFHQGDMRTFSLDQQFDVVVSLFSAIGYMRTIEDLNTAVQNMARHVRPGGLLVVEAWFHPDQFKAGLGAIRADDPAFQLSVMNRSQTDGHNSIMEMNFMISSSAGFEHLVERHEMGLFTDEEYRAAFRSAGLTVDSDPQGWIGREVYCGVKET